MTQAQCEKLMRDKWLEIIDIYKQYNTNATYLSAAYLYKEDEPEITDYYSIINTDNERPIDINTYNEHKLEDEGYGEN